MDEVLTSVWRNMITRQERALLNLEFSRTKLLVYVISKSDPRCLVYNDNGQKGHQPILRNNHDHQTRPRECDP